MIDQTNMHMLQNRWTIYEGYNPVQSDIKMDYKDLIQKVCFFCSVEELGFIQDHTIYGLIKDIFSNPVENKYKIFSRFNSQDPKSLEGQEFQITSLCVFKNDIFPTWEDPANKNGGVLQFEVKPEIFDKLELLYKDLLFNMVGEAEKGIDRINGIRIVDKLMIKQNPHIRFEVWLDFDPNSTDEQLKQIKSSIHMFLLTLQVSYQSSNPQVKVANR